MRNLAAIARVLALATAVIAALADVAAAQDRIGVIASDYSSTAYCTGMDAVAPWAAGPLAGEPVHHDAVARHHDGLLWVVNRSGADNIQVLDPAAGFDTIRQFSLGLGRNLQDIAFAANGEAYVSCYDTAELLRIDPQTGQVLQVISTAPFADADELPETGWLLVRGNRLFVTCQRLDRDNWYSPVGDSYLLVLDIATNAWVDCNGALAGTQGILLAATNPSAPIQVAVDRLLIGCVGFYGMQDGGVAAVDPDALSSLGLEITEAALGGDLVDLEATGASRHVIVANPDWTTRVRRYVPGGGPVDVLVASGYDHADIAWDGGFQLFVADRRLSGPGVRVLDTGSGVQLTGAAIATGLPPAFLAVPRTDGSSPAPPPSLALTLSAPWPNPANPSTHFAFTATPGAAASLRVLDLRGRLVREARVVVDDDGQGGWAFDGLDGSGRGVASGVYRCVVETAAGFAARSFTIVR